MDEVHHWMNISQNGNPPCLPENTFMGERKTDFNTPIYEEDQVSIFFKKQ